MDSLKSILYITYDGLLDPLGESQIIPYIKGINNDKNKIYILSFEKKNNYKSKKSYIELELKKHGIKWIPLIFSNNFGVIGKAYDFFKMYYFGLITSLKNNINIIHGRGHIATQVGVFIKKYTKVKVIFDLRGLWVDERLDKKGWDLNKFFDKKLYIYFKNVERRILLNSDAVVVLTKKVLPELGVIAPGFNSPTVVIPCCADFDHFSVSSHNKYKNIGINLKNNKSTIVLGYIGSIGSMYMIREMLDFVYQSSKMYDVCFMIITRDVHKIERILDEEYEKIQDIVYVNSASRNMVPVYLSYMDITLSFITRTYARIASSPTKIAESLSMGVPVIHNSGIGDVDSIINSIGGGMIIDIDSKAEISKAVTNLRSVVDMGGSELRERSRGILGLETAKERYNSAYKIIGKKNNYD